MRRASAHPAVVVTHANAVARNAATMQETQISATAGSSSPDREPRRRVPCPSVAELKLAQAAVDKRLIAVCNTLTTLLLDDIVRVNRDPRVQTERRDRLLMHLFQHQIHHRGQAHAMLSATAIDPPQLDEFFSITEAPLRAIEFDSLGWTEETVWGP